MRRLALAALAFPLAVSAQTASFVLRSRDYPAGLPVPAAGVAVAEEPAATSQNPAAAGFNRGLTLEYFHERARGIGAGDGVYAGLGPLSISSEWIRPAGAPRYRRLGLGAGFGGRSGSVGLAWNDWASADPGIDSLRTWDLGLAVRPWRHLSLGAAALDLGGRLRGAWLPVRYAFGAATRLAGDALTVSADWYADDEAKGAFRSRAVAFGAALETRLGLRFAGQLQVPTGSGNSGISGATVFVFSLGFSFPNAGLVAAAGGTGSRNENTTLVGVRLSSQSWMGLPAPARPVLVDLGEELSPRRRLFPPAPRDPYLALVRKLQALRDDPEVGRVVVKIDSLPLGAAKADELRAALQDLAAKKPLLAWLHGGGLRELYVATGARRVEMAPPAMLTVTGLASQHLYLKDTLAKLGIAVEVVAMGRYKNAADPFSRSDMSEEEREVVDALLDDVYDRMVKGIAETRKLPEERVRQLVDQGLFSAEEARAAGLVDGLAWPDDVERAARGSLERKWSRGEPRMAQRWGPRPAVAVLRVAGFIVPGRGRGVGLDVTGADTFAELVRKAADDREVRAIVVRVDSPGGDAAGSDLIWRSLQQAKRKGKPVVVSMGDVAASGGYWVSTAGDQVVAEPSTLTGSIGVLAPKPDLSGLLAKIGARAVTLKRGAVAEISSVAKPWSPAERAAVEREVNGAYQTFLERVAEARKMPKEEVDKVAQGRVWTGRQALERKLVDQLGSLGDALAAARRLARIPEKEEVEVRRLEAPRQFLDGLDLGVLADEPSPLLRALASSQEARTLAALVEMGPMLALPIEWFVPLAGGAAEGGAGPH